MSGIGKDTWQNFPVPYDCDVTTKAMALDFQFTINQLELFSGFR
jgi:hypothetical protein